MFKWILALIVLASCQQNKDTNGNPHVLIETGYGDIEAELYPAKAPKTVAAFLSNAEAGIYSGASFYRALKNEDLQPEYNSGLIQGGIHLSKPGQKTPLIPHESPRQTGLSHIDGTLSMARTTPGTASSEFFICIGDQTQFDSSLRTNPDGQGYAAFGRVIKGMDVVRKIQSRPSNGEDIVAPIKIENIKKL